MERGTAGIVLKLRTEEDLKASPEVWAEMIHQLGTEAVTQLLRTPLALKAELKAAERRLSKAPLRRVA